MSVQIIENMIPAALCRTAEAAWPDPGWPYWHRYNGATGNKFGSMDRSRIPPACIAALDALAIAVIPHIGDSFIDYDLHAAGMHMMPPGGFLARHLDAERHPIRPWRRTHSIVLFVATIGESNGGQLVLERQGCCLSPISNVTVIFETKQEWHEVLRTSNQSPYRKTLALFAWEHGECADAKACADFSRGQTSAS